MNKTINVYTSVTSAAFQVPIATTISSYGARLQIKKKKISIPSKLNASLREAHHFDRHDEKFPVPELCMHKNNEADQRSHASTFKKMSSC